jgi:2-oxoglutarate dehydrogenase E1 component
VEQLYPFPHAEVDEELARYGHVQDVVWVQEEPQNMGAWTFVQPFFNGHLRQQHDDRCLEIGYAGRKTAASPSTGSAKLHALQQQAILDRAFVDLDG